MRSVLFLASLDQSAGECCWMIPIRGGYSANVRQISPGWTATRLQSGCRLRIAEGTGEALLSKAHSRISSD